MRKNLRIGTLLHSLIELALLSIQESHRSERETTVFLTSEVVGSKHNTEFQLCVKVPHAL